MDGIDQLLDHDFWATTQLLAASRDLSESQLDQEFDIGHRTLRATLEHQIFNIEAWTAVMAGQPVAPFPDGLSLAALTARHERAYAGFAALARRLRDENRMDDTFPDSWGASQRFGAAIIHVVLHDAEHRTEMLHMLNRLGIPEVPEIDHALWSLEARGA
ncbi:MAG: DinB family protein [Thermomicrobiales bacterium]